MTRRASARVRVGATWLEDYLLPIAVTLLGMGLYLYGLDSKSLWFDELGTLTGAGWGASWLDAIRNPLTIPTTPKPPLYFLVTRLFLALGDYVFLLRLPAALFATLTIPLVYALGRALFDRHVLQLRSGQVGLLGAFLLAIAPLHLRYAQEARMYAAWTFLSLLSLYLFWRAIRSKKWLWWAGFAIATILNLYTHLFAVLTLGVLVFFALWLLLSRRARLSYPFQISHFLIALAAVLLAFTPLVAFAFEGLRGEEGLGGAAAPDWTLGSIVAALRLFSSGSYPGLIAYGALFLLAAVALAVKRSEVLVLAILWIALPTVLVVILPFGHRVVIRYFLYALPIYLLFVACGLWLVLRWCVSSVLHRPSLKSVTRAVTILAYALLVGVLVTLAAPSISSYYSESRQNWRDAIWLVHNQAEPGDKILVRHIYHQKGVLFYAAQWTHEREAWTENDVHVLSSDLVAAFSPDGEGVRWLIVPAQENYLPGGVLEASIQPQYSLLAPIVFRPSHVPDDAQLIAPTSFRSVAVVQAVKSRPPLIRFWVDETAINQGDCTSLHWETHNVREVYLDGEGIVGQGTRQVCPRISTHYELQIIHRDGTVTVQTAEILVSVP